MDLRRTGKTGSTTRPRSLYTVDHKMLDCDTTMQQSSLLGKRTEHHNDETYTDRVNFTNKRPRQTPLVSTDDPCRECSDIPWDKINQFMSDQVRFDWRGKLVVKIGKRYRNIPPSTTCPLCRQLHSPWIEPFLRTLDESDWKGDCRGDRIHIFRHLRHLTHVSDYQTSMNVLRKHDAPYHIAVVPFGRKWRNALQTHIASHGMVVVIPEGRPQSEIFAPQEVSRKFDPVIAASWLECCKQHKTLCNPKSPVVKEMRVIDCNSENIQLHRHADKYVALSYVWGAPTPIQKPTLALPGSQMMQGKEFDISKAKTLHTINNKSQRIAQSKLNLSSKESFSSQTLTNGVETTHSITTTPEENPISRLPSDIPLTIRDAIQVTKALGYRFLWVDSYCINQESEEDKKQQCSRMGDIYAGAQVTIFGLGSDSKYGLPGVSSRARFWQQQSTTIRKYRFISTMPDPHISISQSKWSTRGWTYQEGLFSTRRLFFTDYQTYFECNAMNCVETFKSNLKILHIETGQRFRAFHRSGKFVCGNSNKFSHLNVKSNKANHRKIDTIRRCQYHIQEYTKRELTSKGDILNAFAGIARFYAKTNAKIVSLAGLPIPFPIAMLFDGEHLNHLSYALAWAHDMPEPVAPNSTHPKIQTELTRAQLIQDPRDDPKPQRRHGFPSWSWVGWFGKIELRKDLPYCWTSYLSSVQIGFRKEDPRDYKCLRDYAWLTGLAQYKIGIVEKLLTADELRFDAFVLNPNKLKFWVKDPRMPTRQIPSRIIHVSLSKPYTRNNFQKKLMAGDLKCLVIGTYGEPRKDIFKAIQAADKKAPKARVGRIGLFERLDPDAIVCLVVHTVGKTSFRIGLLKVQVKSSARECVMREWNLSEKQRFILR
jgi:hypothetical protein